MALIDLWKASPEQIRNKQINQIIAFAGEGVLRDGSGASSEFRSFLSFVSFDFLKRYAKECLELRFDGAGFALQDIINQVGSRLGFKVNDGRYRGVIGAVGYDGLWRSPEAHSLIIEVKTTDAYSVRLDTVAGYRKQLIDAREVDLEKSSILIIVGSQNTGDLEAQIRGSRYAWDVRLVSVVYLFKLLALKEDSEDPEIARQIRAILSPQEFTKVDGIVDLLFSTKKDIQDEVQPDNEEEDGSEETEKAFTPVAFHEACIKRICEKLGWVLVKRSRVTFATSDDESVVVCAVSKEHQQPGGKRYWFAFHPHQRDALVNAKKGHIAFGCGSENKTVLIPYEKFSPWISGMNQTMRDDGRMYWHVHIHDDGGILYLHQKAGASKLELNSYLVS